MCKAIPQVMANVSGSVQIQLDPHTDRGVIACKVLFPEQTRVYAQWNIFEIMYRMLFPRLPLGEWYELKSFYKQYQRVRGTEPDWFYDKENAILWVDVYSGPYDIFYVVCRNLTIASFDTAEQEYLRKFRILSLANAKEILARVRGKYGATIPVPGGQMATDAQALLAESMAEKTEVLTWLEKIARYSVCPVIKG
jgi:hypothetical protein